MDEENPCTLFRELFGESDVPAGEQFVAEHYEQCHACRAWAATENDSHLAALMRDPLARAGLARLRSARCELLS